MNINKNLMFYPLNNLHKEKTSHHLARSRDKRWALWESSSAIFAKKSKKSNIWVSILCRFLFLTRIIFVSNAKPIWKILNFSRLLQCTLSSSSNVSPRSRKKSSSKFKRKSVKKITNYCYLLGLHFFLNLNLQMWVFLTMQGLTFKIWNPKLHNLPRIS